MIRWTGLAPWEFEFPFRFSRFAPYYLRCGGHTVVMFMAIEQLKAVWAKVA